MTECIDITESVLSKDKKYLKTLCVPVIGNNARKGDVFTMEFFNIELGQQIITRNITIDGCTFITDVIIHKNIKGYKLYKDNITGNEIKLDIYMYPLISHSDDENFLNDYTYVKNSTNEDRLVLKLDVIQNNVDLSGRHIILTNSIDISNSYLVDFITTYNSITQSHVARMFRTFDGYIPLVLNDNIFYKVVIHVISNNPTDYSGLNTAYFSGLTPINVSDSDEVSDINVTERIEFMDNQYNIITCDVNMDTCYKDLNNYNGSVFTSCYTPSNLFIDRDYPNPIYNVNPFGGTVLSGWKSAKMSVTNMPELTYTITFLRNINKEYIKSFNLFLGPVNDSVLFNSYDCKAVFKLYDAYSNVLLYEYETECNNTTIIKPFKDF